MDFSGFLREEEELDLLYEAIAAEGIVGGTLRGLGGFGGNLISQTAKGAGNIAAGAAGAIGGVGKVGLGVVQGVTGGGHQAVSSIGSGVSDFAKGLGTAAKGVAQTAGAVSGITPALRGIQASREKSFFTPMSSRRTAVQKAMGMNSWDPEGDAVKDRKEEFQSLRQQYAQAHKAGRSDLKRRIRAEMESLDPKAYRVIMAQAHAAKRQKDRERWSDVRAEKPEDFLRGLSGPEVQPGDA